MPFEINDLSVDDEDVEAGAYFPEARDWLEIGRRRVRHQIDRVAKRLKTHGKTLTFPLETSEAWYVIRALGYRADRKSFDYCVRHGHLKPPAKEGNRLLWTFENVVDFAMQLERMRYWTVGRHQHKKTVWELQVESDLRVFFELAGAEGIDRDIMQFGADNLLDWMMYCEHMETRAYLGDLYALRRWEENRRLDATDEELLKQLIEEVDSDARKAVATTIRRRAEKENSK
jgi:hypothetical protein